MHLENECDVLYRVHFLHLPHTRWMLVRNPSRCSILYASMNQMLGSNCLNSGRDEEDNVDAEIGALLLFAQTPGAKTIGEEGWRLPPVKLEHHAVRDTWNLYLRSRPELHCADFHVILLRIW